VIQLFLEGHGRHYLAWLRSPCVTLFFKRDVYGRGLSCAEGCTEEVLQQNADNLAAQNFPQADRKQGAQGLF
jgi:hypothetical protein